MKPVSVIIVVKNNPQHLFETLVSIDGFAYEIIIGTIDIGNIYKKKLLENKKVTIVELKSEIQFADLVKEDLKKFAKGEFILYLDPDEVFPSISSQQLTTLLQEYDYFYFPRKNIIFGKWIRHSRWWPDHQLRLFKKNTVVWPKELHPVPKAKGEGYTFPNEDQYALLHYNYDSIDQYMEKATRYAKSEALSYIQKNQSYYFASAAKKAISEFISRYFGADGYKDGAHGLTLAILQMFYCFLVYFYFWEYKKYIDIDKNLPQEFQNFTKKLYSESNFWVVKKNLISISKKIKIKVQGLLLEITS